MSIDNPVIMLIFPIYFLVSYWENVSDSNVTMKFAQLHYFLPQNIGGTKYIMSPLSKSWEDMSPPSPHTLGPCVEVILWERLKSFEKIGSEFRQGLGSLCSLIGCTYFSPTMKGVSNRLGPGSASEQRWPDCHILRSRSSPEFLNLSPSLDIVQNRF